MKWNRFHILYGGDIEEAARVYDLDKTILAGLIMQESRGNPNARSHCGAWGLTQVMPATAKDRGYKLNTARQQIFAGADYLSYVLLKFAEGDIVKALAGYNAGPGRIKNDCWMKFKETRKYVPRVIKYAAEYGCYLETLKDIEPSGIWYKLRNRIKIRRKNKWQRNDHGRRTPPLS